MNQNGEQKDNSLKIALIIIGSVVGVVVLGIIAFLFLTFTIFNKNLETYEEKKDQNYNSSSSGENNYQEEEEEPEEILPPVQEFTNIHKIEYRTFKEMIEHKETFVIVISQTSCGHCIVYKPIFDEALRANNLTGYELDLQVATKEDRVEFLDTYPIDGTPTTMIFTNGELEEEMLISVQQKDVITNFLKKYNLVK